MISHLSSHNLVTIESHKAFKITECTRCGDRWHAGVGGWVPIDPARECPNRTEGEQNDND